jgi:hypothetical protein
VNIPHFDGHALMSFAQWIFEQVVANASRINGEEFIRTFRKILFQGIEPPK